MRANVGDWLRLRGKHVGDSDRVGVIRAVGENGAPPYKVRFDGVERTVYPGPDAVIENAGMGEAAEAAEEFTEDFGREFAGDARRVAHAAEGAVHGVEHAGEKIGEAFRR
jgi:hypothetical protein